MVKTRSNLSTSRTSTSFIPPKSKRQKNSSLSTIISSQAKKMQPPPAAANASAAADKSRIEPFITNTSKHTSYQVDFHMKRIFSLMFYRYNIDDIRIRCNFFPEHQTYISCENRDSFLK